MATCPGSGGGSGRALVKIESPSIQKANRVDGDSSADAISGSLYLEIEGRSRGDQRRS